MRTGRSRAQALVLASLLLGVAACGSPESTGEPSGAGGGTGAAAGGAAGGAGRDDCLTGTWAVDVQELARQAATRSTTPGEGTAEGTITVSFGEALSIVYANTFTLTSKTSGGLAVGVQDTYEGTASSTDYRAEGGHLTGSMATNTVTKTTAVVVGTQIQPAASAPLSGVLDLAQGVTSYTCSGSALTLSTGDGFVDWHLTKA